MKRKNLIIIIVLIGLSIFLSNRFALNAANMEITVTTTRDQVPGSLRDAVNKANESQTDTLIILPAGTYLLEGTHDDNDNNGGDLDLAGNFKITIQGSDHRTTFIDGNQIDRVFHIISGTVSISDVTIQNGKTPAGQSGYTGKDGNHGGGIYNDSNLSLTECDIINNVTGMGGDSNGIYDNSGNGGNGGGIYNRGTLILRSCNINENLTGIGGGTLVGGIHVQLGNGGSGGGIYNSGVQTINDCTINKNETGRSGWYSNDGDFDGNGGDGGGIFNSGTQTITNCRITANITGLAGDTDGSGERGGRGGGICSNEGNSNVLNSYISDNTTGTGPWQGFGGDGGGIYNKAVFSLSNSTLENNASGWGYKGGNGGGIANRGAFYMYASTINSNVTGSGYLDQGFGGGIFNGSFFYAENSTISGNVVGTGKSEYGSNGDGGGIYNDESATFNLISCTIHLNRVGHRSGETFSWTGYGGGIYNTKGLVNIKNTIVAGNLADAPENGYDCWGNLFSYGYSLIQDAGYCTIYGELTGNLTGVDPKLEKLADNDGPTATHALRANSPALDAGYNFDLTTDQRGLTRPTDLADITNQSNGTDIGAYESQHVVTPLVYYISGQVTANRTPLAEVNITLSNNGGKTVTDDDGYFSIMVRAGWSGRLNISRKDYTFSPAYRDYETLSSDQTDQDFSASPIAPPHVKLNRQQLNFGVMSGGVKSASQVLLISNSGGGTLNWQLEYLASWLNCDQVTGTGPAAVTFSVSSVNLSPGSYYETIKVFCSDAPDDSLGVTVSLTVYPALKKNLPFGSFDSPLEKASISGSIAVTGWAIDNIGIQSVKIYRSRIGQSEADENQLIYIGEAIMVEGTRPDVKLLYPEMPDNYKAGWGYMLLTNTLPNQGNGSFTIYAEATDIEGNSVILGQRKITCNNNNAVKPFGALDSPVPGSTISGTDYAIFGWALSPDNTIPMDGSTITVWLDGKPIGHPVYNLYRRDIAHIFPGYTNSNGAGGYFVLDTTKYENGLHTVAWSVTDDAGNKNGIGSRYFIINNHHTGEPDNKTTMPVNEE